MAVATGTWLDGFGISNYKTGKMKYFLVALVWAGYCVLHSYLISNRVTNLMALALKRYYAYYRIFYVAISIGLLIPLLNFTVRSDSNVIITYGLTLNIVRYVLILGSAAMFLWAFFIDYDSLSFIGIRQILNSRKTVHTNPPKEIKKGGLLGIIRHPMYFALIIFLWCQTFKVMDIVVNTVLTVYVFIGTILEERKLVLEFGDTYIRYQQEVPMLLPFTKAKNRNSKVLTKSINHL